MNKSEHLSAPIHEDGVDLISNLPDHVLPLILSRLPSTKESIRTSILSRRWRYLWTSLPSLDLECRGGWNHSEKNKFKSIVNRALLHRSVNLDSLRLVCCNYFSTSTVERWIHLTVMRNVKKLDLTFWSKEESEDQVLPNCLVTCASLEVLRLQGGRLIVPSFSGFPALRVLNLNVELFDDDLVKHFLESFPLLEDLTLDGCSLENLDLLCISCPKLKVLRFFNVDKADICGCLKLSCPKLVFLQIECQVASNYISEGLYSLKKAVIYPDYEDISELFHTMSGLFHIISHVESLTTNLYFLYECIDVAPDLVLPNLKTLKLYTRNTGYTVKGLNQTLRMCPKLESLCLNFEEVYTYKDYSEDYDETEYPKLDGVGTSNLTPDVKWVEFFEFNGEKPKLTIHWYDKNKTEWKYVVAKWDKNLFRLAKWDRNRKQNNQVAQNNNTGPQQPPPGEVMMASLYQLIQDGPRQSAHNWNRLGAIVDYQHDRMLYLENLIYHLENLIYQSRRGGVLPPKFPNYPYWRDGHNNNGNGNGQDGSDYQGGDGCAYNWNRYGAMLAYNHDRMAHFENVIYQSCRGGMLPPRFPNFLYWRDGDNKKGGDGDKAGPSMSSYGGN